jgi:uracil-DNA glycosylase
MPRRNADPAFVADQLAHRHDPHVEPINRLVDHLSTDDRWMPYVSPIMGGVNAKVLFVFQDPGPKTAPERGSGMLSPENDDPSAELLMRCLAAAGLPLKAMTAWNAYPWYLPQQQTPTASMLEAGTGPLERLLELLPDVTVVCLCGSVAHDFWDRFQKIYPSIDGRYAIKTLHPSHRGITRGDRIKRGDGIRILTDDIRRAAAHAGVKPE